MPLSCSERYRRKYAEEAGRPYTPLERTADILKRYRRKYAADARAEEGEAPPQGEPAPTLMARMQSAHADVKAKDALRKEKVAGHMAERRKRDTKDAAVEAERWALRRDHFFRPLSTRHTEAAHAVTDAKLDA